MPNQDKMITLENLSRFKEKMDETIPHSTSDLANDSGFITSEDIPPIPDSTSDLVNDSGFITSEDIPPIPDSTSDLVNDSGFVVDTDLATVATTGSYDDLSDVPPTATDAEIDSLFPVIVNDATALAQALQNGGKVMLGADVSRRAGFGVLNDTELDLNGHTIQATGANALNVDGGAKLTIKGSGQVLAQEFGVAVYNGSELEVNGGTFTTTDNCVFGTNGTAGMGENTIVINGGEFNGNITSPGYIACGIYMANNDTLIVNGGTFNIENGVGILARSGNTTINEGAVINVTGTGTGWVGDSKIQVPAGKEIVQDLSAHYPGGEPVVTNNSQYEVYELNQLEGGENVRKINYL